MKTAITQGLGVGVLALCVSASLAGPARVEGKSATGRGPEAGAPKLQGRPDATPRRQLPEPRTLEEGAPSSSEEAPGRGQGCPDQGRKLELIV